MLNSKLLKSILIPTLGVAPIGAIAAVSTSCSPVVIVTGVSLDKESLVLGIGESDTLTATVLPEDAADKSVTWSSSDSSVATVDNNGKVTAVSEGQATITVITNDSGFTDTCQVTVVNQKIHVIGVWLDKESLSLEMGDYDTLAATVLPENATDKSVTWSSSDSSVATVDNNGKVTAVSKGQATITVTTNDGGLTATCDVTVVDASAIICVAANEDSRLELKNASENNPNLQYSDDGKNWTTYSGIINVPANGKIYLKGDNANGWSQSSIKYSNFVITGNVSLYGNIMGLLDNGTGAISSIPNDYCFYGLFSNSPGITSVSENFLPATTLTKNCYDHMFIGCSSLTTAPTFLPATTLADSCYAGMFHSCTSLTTAPDLPATTLADFCYWNMFNGCTSLLRAPNVLPATNLVFGCYASMFQGCTSLTTAPDLPATQLVDGCYSLMFYNCHRLALIRIGYNGTVSEASSGGSFTNWVTGVAQTGTFYYKGSDTLENFGFPSSWTINPN